MILNTVLALVVAHSAPGAVPKLALSAELLKVAAAYHIDAVLLTRTMLVESRGIATARNRRTGDYGLMQISPSMAKAYHISKACLKDWKCNLRRGAQIIRDMRRSAHYRPCVYNVGQKGLRIKPTACAKYELKLANL